MYLVPKEWIHLQWWDMHKLVWQVQSELLKRRVSPYEIFPVQEKFLRPLGSTMALDQPAVYDGFVLY